MTFTQTLAGALGAAFLFGGVAFAGDLSTARLQGPAAAQQIVARSTVWTCEGDTCRARPNHAVSVSACRAFVREAGPVAAYGTEQRQLTAEQLTACNAAARQASN